MNDEFLGSLKIQIFSIRASQKRCLDKSEMEWETGISIIGVLLFQKYRKNNVILYFFEAEFPLRGLGGLMRLQPIFPNAQINIQRHS